jgi:predicted phosphoribosyltransferase
LIVIADLPELRDHAPVFADRAAAGRALARLLEGYRASGALVLAIPAGGVPVAAEIAAQLALELDVAPVSKMLLPWTTESGFGAVAFDGSTWMEPQAARYYGLTPAQIEHAAAVAREKVGRRLARLRGGRAAFALAGRTAIVVDDGVAAGSTMRAAVAALRKLEPARIVIAVPTGSARSLERLEPIAEEICCANLRYGASFAVADAYERWYDVGEDEVAAILAAAGKDGAGERASRAKDVTSDR